MTRGEQKMYVLELGPLTCNGPSKRDVARMERRIRDDLDALVRQWFRVGKYSKEVRTRITPYLEDDPRE